MSNEITSQTQRDNELQLIRQSVTELEQDKVRYQQLMKLLLFENDESVRDHFDNYFHSHHMTISVDVFMNRVLRCNRAVIETLGFGRTEIIGHAIFKIYHQDGIEDARELFGVIAETGGSHDAKQVLRKKDGDKIHVSLNATTVRDEYGNPALARFDWREIAQRTMENSELRSGNRQPEERRNSNGCEHSEVFCDVITQDSAMYSIFRQMEFIAVTGDTVLITGETGVGKEKIARIIHQLSGRLGEFISVNVAGLDDLMFSDTLFGHRKGAFTGAESERRGLVELARGGTLFLDEIGDLGLESQMKLLRFLQDGEYRCLGEDASIESDVRVVAATNQSIESLARGGNFRSDLYYRLETHHIHLPPLRERKGDIRLLVNHFLKKAAENLGKKIPFLPHELFTLLSTYHFPGNIRELESMVNDAVTRHECGVLSTKSFLQKIDDHTSFFPKDWAHKDGTVTFSDALSLLPELPELKEVQKLMISEVLRRTDGNQKIAARLLGISRETLNRRLSRARSSKGEA